jgi:hypothetical protein
VKCKYIFVSFILNKVDDCKWYIINVYFGYRILEDLVSQVEDYESFFTKNKDKEDENDIKRIETLLELLKRL